MWRIEWANSRWCENDWTTFFFVFFLERIQYTCVWRSILLRVIYISIEFTAYQSLTRTDCWPKSKFTHSTHNAYNERISCISYRAKCVDVYLYTNNLCVAFFVLVSSKSGYRFRLNFTAKCNEVTKKKKISAETTISMIICNTTSPPHTIGRSNPRKKKKRIFFFLLSCGLLQTERVEMVYDRMRASLIELACIVEQLQTIAFDSSKNKQSSIWWRIKLHRNFKYKWIIESWEGMTHFNRHNGSVSNSTRRRKEKKQVKKKCFKFVGRSWSKKLNGNWWREI